MRVELKSQLRGELSSRARDSGCGEIRTDVVAAQPVWDGKVDGVLMPKGGELHVSRVNVCVLIVLVLKGDLTKEHAFAGRSQARSWRRSKRAQRLSGGALGGAGHMRTGVMWRMRRVCTAACV